jgi:hypothetical protein
MENLTEQTNERSLIFLKNSYQVRFGARGADLLVPMARAADRGARHPQTATNMQWLHGVSPIRRRSSWLPGGTASLVGGSV